MKKLLFLLFILPAVAFAQNTKVTYIKGECEMNLLDSMYNKMTGKPYGKNVSITYDTFFKNYVLTMELEDGSKSTMKLSFVREDPNGRVRYVDETTDPKQPHYFTVKDEIKTFKTIEFMFEDVYDGKRPSLYISKLRPAS